MEGLSRLCIRRRLLTELDPSWVCIKVASYLEQGSRLENLSWRLWHLQNLIVDTNNAKSRHEFKKLSKCMEDKLDKEKDGMLISKRLQSETLDPDTDNFFDRSIEELSVPDFKGNHLTNMIGQRVAEKERNREASLNIPGTIKRMQFTFFVDQPLSLYSCPVKKLDTKSLAESSRKLHAGSLEKAYEATSAAAAGSASPPSVSTGPELDARAVPIPTPISALPELMRILFIRIRIRRLRLWAPMTNLARAMLR